MTTDPAASPIALAFVLAEGDLQEALPATTAWLLGQGAELQTIIAGPAGEGGTPPAVRLDQPDAELIEALRRELQTTRPRWVLLPAMADAYARLAGALWEAMRRSGTGGLLVGELDSPLTVSTGWHAASAGTSAGTSTELPGTSAREALRRYRCAAHGGVPGNIYWQADPLAERFPGGVQHRLQPADAGYRIDVIIRSTGRDTLCQAVDSVLAQTWGNIGLILVSVGQRSLADWLDSRAWPAHVQPTLVEAPGASRSQAANLGLAAVSGDAFVFLDDDDLIYPSHLSLLARALDAHPGAVVAYGGVRIEKRDAEGRWRGVDCLNEPFDPERLHMENFIPIHACLTRRRMRDAGVRFDETLGHFEDWDFWLKCSEHGPFHHIPEVVGVYFAGDASGVASAGMGPVYERWLARRGAAPLEGIARWALSRNTPGARAIRREAEALGERLREVEDELAALRARQAAASDDHAQLGRQLASQADEKAHLLAEVREQQARIDDLLASTSWRVTAPLRLAGRARQVLHAHGGGPSGAWRLFRRFLLTVRQQGILPAWRRVMQRLGSAAGEGGSAAPAGETPPAGRP